MKIKSNLKLLFWELTKKCNLKCKHCRAIPKNELNQNELSLGEIETFLSDLKTWADPIIVLSGGEPLYRKDIFKIISISKKQGFKTALATNGTLITPEIAAKLKNIDRVSISLDGSKANIHDTFRGIEGSFDKAIKAIEYLKNENIQVQINTTITKENKDDLSNLIELTKQLKLAALHIFILVPTGCGITIKEEEKLNKIEYEKILRWIYKKQKEEKIQIKVTCGPHYYRILKQNKVEFDHVHSMHSITRGCLAGTNVCFLSHIGEVKPCGYFDLVAGTIRESSLKEIWDTSIIFNELRDTSLLKGKCGICKFNDVCGGCRARAYEFTKDYLAEEPICAYVPKNK